MTDPDYDEIDYLIDNDPIRLGERCRAAEARIQELERRVDQLVSYANYLNPEVDW